jgi:hypothetical protein
MTDLYVHKKFGMLVPCSEGDSEVIQHLQEGEVFKVSFTRPRNVKFHRKYFALLDILFDLFHPTPVFHNGMEVLKSRDRFRKDIAIATGHYTLTVNIKGEVRAEAKSISFANMDETEFAMLYSRTIDYGLQKIAIGRTKAELEAWVQSILDFA